MSTGVSPPRRFQLRRINPSSYTEAPPSRAPIEALFDRGTKLETDGFPTSTPGRTAGIEAVRGAWKGLRQVLIENRQPHGTAWAERVLPRPDQTDELEKVKNQFENALGRMQTFILEVTAEVQELKQSDLSGEQREIAYELEWYTSNRKMYASDRYADAAVSTMIELMYSLIAPYSDEGRLPLPSPKHVALDVDEASFVITHFRKKLTDLKSIAKEFRDTIILAAKTAGVHPNELLPKDVRGLRQQLRLLNTHLIELDGEGDGARAWADREQRKRLVIAWHQQRDHAFREGLSGVYHKTYENLGGGHCGYASFVAGVGHDGVTPDPGLGWGMHSTMHTHVRHRASDWLRGPGGGAPLGLKGIRHYQRARGFEEELLRGGDLDAYDRSEAWNIKEDVEQMTVYRWSKKPLSAGRADGETRMDFRARGGEGQFNLSPIADPESENAYGHRVTQAYNAWIDNTLRYAYWAQSMDWTAIAATYKRRIHIYHITNDPPDSIYIRQFDHYISFGDPMHRPVCIAWTTADYRMGNANRHLETTQVHYAVILCKERPYAPRVGHAEALLPYADDDVPALAAFLRVPTLPALALGKAIIERVREIATAAPDRAE